MNIPILLNHDLDRQIGKVEPDGTIELSHGQELTMSQLFDTFGNCHIEIFEVIKSDEPLSDKDRWAGYKIRKFRIRYFSVDPFVEGKND